MHAGKRIEIDITDHKRVSVRDYGRGIPQGKLMEAVSVLNTGGIPSRTAFSAITSLKCPLTCPTVSLSPRRTVWTPFPSP
ncbi:MAG: hypothetical protein IIV80_00385, partial [Clostridia bacterium]|nr:hypothetical protein [Clostridia bacterium]